VVNGDDVYLPGAAVRPDLEKVLFAVENPDADVRALDIVSGAEGTRFTIADKARGSLPAYIPAMGLHKVRNALSAYALATRLGLAPAAAAAALANYQTTGHRQHVVEHGGVTVIEDCYNANPDSMRAALLTLKEYPVRGRRVAVLGDMFELGTITRQAHAEVGALAARCGVDLLLTVGGGHADRAATAPPHWARTRCIAGTRDEALARLYGVLPPGRRGFGEGQPRHGVRDDSGRVLQSRAQGLKAQHAQFMADALSVAPLAYFPAVASKSLANAQSIRCVFCLNCQKICRAIQHLELCGIA
jgi:UDP-N-acetylmuramoyl-tripeptide--D-alanyl-D-alanine ligase